MRSDFYNRIKQNKMDYFEKIKLGQNPNAFRNRVEEELEKTDLPVVEEVALKPLLQVQRVYDHNKENVTKETLTPLLQVQRVHAHDDEDEEEECDEEENNDDEDDAVMITLGSIRIRNFLNNCYDRVVKAFYEWFEIELPVVMREGKSTQMTQMTRIFADNNHLCFP